MFGSVLLVRLNSPALSHCRIKDLDFFRENPVLDREDGQLSNKENKLR